MVCAVLIGSIAAPLSQRATYEIRRTVTIVSHGPRFRKQATCCLEDEVADVWLGSANSTANGDDGDERHGEHQRPGREEGGEARKAGSCGQAYVLSGAETRTTLKTVPRLSRLTALKCWLEDRFPASNRMT